MSFLLTLIVLAGAFGLSWYSAHASGRLWTESKIVGGWPRVMVIGSLVLSAIGFTGVYFMLLMVIVPLFYAPLADVEVQALFPLSLGVLGAPGAGSVPNLWLDHQVVARRQQILGAMASPGGGSSLPWDALDILSGTLDTRGLWGWLGDSFGSLFGGGDSGGGGGDSDSGSWVLILLILALIVLALFAGIATTILIVQSADREHVGEIFDIYKSPENALQS